MAMLTWDEFMLPVLQVLSEGETLKLRNLMIRAADRANLTDEDRAEVIPSGDPRYLNRLGWAVTYLHRASALDRPQRGHYVISEAGRKLLAQHPAGITEKNLNDFVEREGLPTMWESVDAPEQSSIGDVDTLSKLDPIEQVEEGVQRLHTDVAAELLNRLHRNDPVFFEQAVLDLLIAMGYGGTEGKATHTQLSHDGGIDGVIDQDALGLSRIYVQAKRYALDAVIGRADIQGFVGALQGAQANQGVFLTTARFSRHARDYAEAVASRVVLVDGARLADMMIRYGVGVQVQRTVKLVEIDEDFFE